MLQRRERRLGAQPGQHRAHALGRAGNGAVNAFGREQNQPPNLLRFAERLQRFFILAAVGQVHKAVKSRREVGQGHAGVHGCSACPVPARLAKKAFQSIGPAIARR